MLIEFKVTNFRSIYDTQTLNMAGSTSVELGQNICPADFGAELSLVRSAVIYGPNAGGKSNLIRALWFMRRLIISSAKESQAGEKIPVIPFLFDKKSCQQPSEFEITFSKEGVRYQYGFVSSEKRILEEWLFAYPSGRMQRWFTRTYDEKRNKYTWEFSKFLKGEKQKTVDLTRPEVLFLSNAVNLNNEQLLPVFKWFQQDLVVKFSSDIEFGKSLQKIKTSEGKQKIIKYLNIADPSIIDVLLKIEKFSEDKLPANMPQELKNFLKKNMDGQDIEKIDFTHAGDAKLNLGEESNGTRKFFGFAGEWEDVLEHGKVIVIDELENSLHPLVVWFLIGLICNPEMNKKNAQLIFSTHDTSLLNTELFRRDQVWFVEKDKKNSTQLYPLLDFSPRKNEAVGRGYLQGRYGALPFIGDWRF